LYQYCVILELSEVQAVRRVPTCASRGTTTLVGIDTFQVPFETGQELAYAILGTIATTNTIRRYLIEKRTLIDERTVQAFISSHPDRTGIWTGPIPNLVKSERSKCLSSGAYSLPQMPRQPVPRRRQYRKSV
jgi:hypothetical protein